MKLGSHNSLTYLPPKHWYMYPFFFMAKCQCKDYRTQYNLGVRLFDVRIKPSTDINEEPVIGHGLMSYKTKKGFMDEFLIFLNTQGAEENIYIRMVYEIPKEDKSKDAKLKEDVFAQRCKIYQEKYPNIHFTCGVRKYDWKPLLELEQPPCTKEYYSSVTWKKIDDWCPWLYATFMNKKTYKKHKDSNSSCFLTMDFIKDFE